MKSLTPLTRPTTSAYMGAPESAELRDPKKQNAWQQAVDFESVFLNTMYGQMFSGIGSDAPLGGKHSEAWRSMLVDEYAKTTAAKGGIGLAPHIYRELIGAQQAAPRKMPALPKVQ